MHNVTEPPKIKFYSPEFRKLQKQVDSGDIEAEKKYWEIVCYQDKLDNEKAKNGLTDDPAFNLIFNKLPEEMHREKKAKELYDEMHGAKKRTNGINVPKQHERWLNWQQICFDFDLQRIYKATDEFENLEPEKRWNLIQEKVIKHNWVPTKIATLKLVFRAGDDGFLKNFEADLQRMEKIDQDNTE